MSDANGPSFGQFLSYAVKKKNFRHYHEEKIYGGHAEEDIGIVMARQNSSVNSPGFFSSKYYKKQ